MFSKKLKEGSYRAVLILNEEKGIELPFNFDVKYKGKKPTIIIKNADERIVVNEITIKGDSVNFKMPVFDTEFKTVFVNDNLEGLWINNYKTANNKIKFKATYGETNRFPFVPGKANPYFEGRWETTFSPNTKDSTKAIGIFHHIEQTDYVTGTFLTETGDYRYLEGMKNGNKLYLSCFDGSHAFLFIAELKNETLSGMFYSGATWQEPWEAKLNEKFELANADEITFLKNKDEKLNFSFPDLNKKLISLSDKKFENKPVIIQVMGSWCPNCMDESRYLADVYNKYKNEGLEIIALAFEKSTGFEKSKSQLLRLKKKLNIEYDILITQKVGKDKASETLSALNKIVAFPTTLFLNKKHQVVKINTGFSGPATGKAYEKFKEDTEALIKNLLKE
ncbi:TlpA disulfide reductase family protein [Sediminibacterium sp.]|uniref:TlpA disulfide reductase family protein n=1 Tax=Sediminibacterium sp. TaxID=1917865 RepID=UPI0027292167|nr:TlpA disulfide reductase family protein [Sediminibacterium sp.]MDO9000418.1 TlpA disulfide reductase family protein [Bacteroidota bacterium]MDP3147014.1 TlpA disulfide reductase family protein [Bacteroidota bacterium]MDP3567449.1 TlpA disulfide reductase family protein [Sediminibacterium sp.]